VGSTEAVAAGVECRAASGDRGQSRWGQRVWSSPLGLRAGDRPAEQPGGAPQ